MANAQTFLTYVVRVAVDKFTGSPERTDEGIQILKEWAGKRDAQAVSSGVAEAKHEASDPAVLRDALDQAAAENGRVLNDQEREELEVTVVSGLSSVSRTSQNTQAAIDALVEQLIPGKRSYVVWLDTPEFVGADEAGRYFHFSYNADSYRVRDYIGGNIFHPADRQVTEKPLNAIELKMTAAQIWNASKGQIRCTKEYGLFSPVTNREGWRQRLLLLTEVAKQFQQ